ncbi:hypothetical protein B0H17DRAFT_1210870 [Mycena rosella]|uniref:DUF726-domain-containing protein n=1 Tax=Mycena rosella TaxID=1033263 RepID=A0AAD7G6V8_MYCRO|nr:hypothetical protein B0H17DRAFT_1210870 [Mycena rosella]
MSRSQSLIKNITPHNLQHCPYEIDPEAVLDIIRKAEPNVKPNPGFLLQLKIFHKAAARGGGGDEQRGGLPETDMFARFPRTPSDSAPTTPGGGHRRRIRCKMCRQELATREHILDHGQLGTPMPTAGTPVTSRHPSMSIAVHPRLGSATSSSTCPCRPSPTPHVLRAPRRPHLRPLISGIVDFIMFALNMGGASTSALETEDASDEDDSGEDAELQPQLCMHALGCRLSDAVIVSPAPTSPMADNGPATRPPVTTRFLSTDDIAVQLCVHPKLAVLLLRHSGYFVEPIKWMEVFLEGGANRGQDSEEMGIAVQRVSVMITRVITGCSRLEIQEDVEKMEQQELIEGRQRVARKKRHMMLGLLAPVIGMGLGTAFSTIVITGTTGFLAGAGAAAIITTGGMLTGSSIAIRGMINCTQQVWTFEVLPLHNNKRVNCILTISGFMTGKLDGVRLPFSVLDPVVGDMFSILWEPEMIQETGSVLKILTGEVLTQIGQTAAGCQAIVMTALMSALQWPIILTKLGYLINNPGNNVLDRAKAAGSVLADVLMQRHLGVRPIMLIGFSLGARVIFYALIELAKHKVYGIVQDVFILGTTISVPMRMWCETRSVVSGRYVNAFARNDWVLNYLFCATSGGVGTVAGLHPIENVPGLENVDVTDKIASHMSYRTFMPLILDQLGFPVFSDYFNDPVEPDFEGDRIFAAPAIPPPTNRSESAPPPQQTPTAETTQPPFDPPSPPPSRTELSGGFARSMSVNDINDTGSNSDSNTTEPPPPPDKPPVYISPLTLSPWAQSGRPQTLTHRSAPADTGLLFGGADGSITSSFGAAANPWTIPNDLGKKKSPSFSVNPWG